MLISITIFFSILSFCLSFLYLKNRRVMEKTENLLSQELDSLYKTIKEIARGNFCPKAQIYTINEEKLAKKPFVSKLRELVEEVNTITTEPLNRLCYSGADSYQEGYLCGQTLGELMGGTGEAAIIEWNDRRASTKIRRKGFEQALEDLYPSITILGYEETEADQQQTYSKTLEIFKKYPRLSGLYISEGITPPAAVKAIKQSNRKIHFVTHDLTAEIRAGIIQGYISATLSQNLYSQGFNPLIHVHNFMANGKKPRQSRNLSSLDIITSNNIDQYWDASTGFRLDEKTRHNRPLPERKTLKRKKILFLGEEKFAIHQQIKQGVTDATDQLYHFGSEVQWITIPGGTAGEKPVEIEEMIDFIEKICSENPDALVVKVSYEAIVDYLNTLAAKGIVIATYNAEPLGVRGLFGQINENAEKLLATSNILTQGNTESKQAMSEIAGSMQEVVSGAQSLREQSMSGKTAIDSIKKEALELNSMAEKQSIAVNSARESAEIIENGFEKIISEVKDLGEIGAIINNSVASMNKLSALSRKISGIAKTMDEVAVQTNLLSLNAAIEASHAGESGKGFGVVAGEIRKLSHQSSLSSEEIESLIKTVQKTIGDSQDAIVSSQQAFTTHMESIEKITNLYNEQLMDFHTYLQKVVKISERNRTSSQTIHESSENIVPLIDKVVTVSEENTAASEEISATAEQISAQTESISQTSSYLNSMAQALRGLIHQFQTEEERKR